MNKSARTKAKDAYDIVVKEFKWETTNAVALAKFGCLCGFSVLKFRKDVISGVPQDDIWPFSEAGRSLIENLNSDNGPIIAKVLRAKYSGVFASSRLKLKAIRLLALAQCVIMYCKWRNEPWLNTSGLK